MTENTTTAASGAATLGPLNDRAIRDAIRSAYDLGYNDARAARTAPGDGALGYTGRDVERDHGGALIHALSRALAAPAAQEAEPAVLPVAAKTHGAWDGLELLDQLPDGTELYAHPPRPQADAGAVPDGRNGLPVGWVPLSITHEGQYPEEVAYGPQVMMDRLGKWLQKYFSLIAAAPQAPAAATESVLIDGVAYSVPAAVAGELLRLHLEAMEAPAAPTAAAAERQYISPVKTVADLANNLLTLDQSLPIYAAQSIEHGGRRRIITVPPTVSRERVKDKRWIGEGDALNAAVIWTRAEQPAAAQAPAAGAAPSQSGVDAVLALPTYRPVWLQFCATMHRDVEQQEHGWVRRSDVVSALGAAAPAQEADDGWMPIETAPKDGTEIDLFNRGGHREAGAFWGLPPHECGEMGRYCDSDWHGYEPGWVTDFWGEPQPDSHFSHWRRKPAPPAARARQEGGAA